MRRQRALDVQHRAAIQAVIHEELAGEVRRAIGILARDDQRVGLRCRQKQRRRGRRRADAPEAASKRASKIEHAKVQPGRRFDEDSVAHACSGATPVIGVV